MAQTLSLAIPKADQMTLRLDMSPDGIIQSAELTGIGGPDLLKVLSDWRPKLKGHIGMIPMPEGNTTGEMMLRQLLLQFLERWQQPYTEAELCHCRAVPTQVVESAILLGAHTPEAVSRWTSASTSCGTCRRDVMSILAARLPASPAKKAG